MLLKPLKVLPVALLVIFIAGAAFAGTTGKIAGVITDKQTGEPLPGVNVVIAGTNIGAATNIQGEFFIINVPPGKYTLKVDLIGYRPVEVTNVVVSIDLTTKMDLDLETETIDMGTITVEAERPLIEKDVTSSRMRISPAEITNSAAGGLIGRVNVNAGNVLGSFRGSRDDTGEIVYLLDGVNLANPLSALTGITPGSGPSSALATYIPDEAVAEAEVLTGGFGAEYPNVQSAVINVVGKEGGKTYSGKFKTRSSPDAIFGIDTYGDRTYNSAGTPIKIKPTYDTLGQVESWEWTDDPLYDDNRRSKAYDMRQHDWSLGGPVPLEKLDIPGEMNFFTSGTYQSYRSTYNPNYWRKNQSLQGKLTYNISSSKKLTISGITSYSDRLPRYYTREMATTWGKSLNFSGPIYWLGAEGWYRPQEEDLPAGSEPYYVVTPDGLDTVYSYTPYGWIVAPGYLSTDADTAFFHTLNGILGVSEGDEYYFEEFPSGEFDDVTVNGISLLEAVQWAADSIETRGIARTYSNYDMSNNVWSIDSWSNEFSVNFTNNLSPKSFYNLTFSRFQTSQRFRCHDPWDDHPLSYDEMQEMRFISMGATQYQGFFINPMYLGRRRTGDDDQIIYTLKGDFTSQVNINNLMKMGFEYKKFDLFKDHTSIASGGNDYNDQFHVKPFQIGVYAQDKLESEGMILNIGLRYDYFDPNTVVPDNINDPLLQQYLDDPQNVETMFDLPKRLKGAVDAKYKQQLSPRIGISFPITENDVLHVSYGHYFQLPMFSYFYGNHAYDLRGAHKYMGNPNLKEEKTVAYEAGLEHGFNDYLKLSVVGFFKDIANLTTYKKTYFSNAFYWLFTNSDYARVKGFEFTLTQRPWRGLSGVITYTYQIVRGRASDGYQTFLDDYYNRKPRTEDFPLDWDQRNTARANINYRVPADWGPVVSDYHLFGDWGIDFFWTYGSGTPYTGVSSVPQPEIPPVNDKTFPESWRIDLRFDKGFNIYKTYKTNFFVEVRNLTNRADIIEEPADFDVERYELTGEPGGQFANPDVYTTPRRVLLGMEITF